MVPINLYIYIYIDQIYKYSFEDIAHQAESMSENTRYCATCVSALHEILQVKWLHSFHSKIASYASLTYSSGSGVDTCILACMYHFIRSKTIKYFLYEAFSFFTDHMIHCYRDADSTVLKMQLINQRKCQKTPKILWPNSIKKDKDSLGTPKGGSILYSYFSADYLDPSNNSLAL